MPDSSSDQDKFTLVATGDCLIFQKISIFNEPEFLKVKDIIEQGDVSFTNFETITPNGKGHPRYKRDPTTWMTSPPCVLDGLLWMGFNLFSLANNHSMDYSEGGLLETLRVFKEKGVACSGTGKVLSEARAPCYLDTEKARVALVTINTGDSDGPAGDPYGTVPGRPGVNPLRYETVHFLEKEDYDKLVDIAGKLGLPASGEGRLNFLGNIFVVGEKGDITTTPYGPDVEGNLESIRKAKKYSDYVFVAIHNHIKSRPGAHYFDDTIEHVSSFVEDFSRQAVDAGADAVLGTGTHTLNGIEIYKGCPIFYGLGNFIAQNYQSNPKPYDWHEARGLINVEDPDDQPSSLYADLDEEAAKRSTRRLSSSVVAKIEYIEGKAEQLTLFPIDIPRVKNQDGRPLLTSGGSAEEILTRLVSLSSGYGTTIKIEGDRGMMEF